MNPTEVVIGFWRWFWVAVGGLVLVAGIIVGGWQANWWFASHNVNRQTQLLHNSYSIITKPGTTAAKTSCTK